MDRWIGYKLSSFIFKEILQYSRDFDKFPIIKLYLAKLT